MSQDGWRYLKPGETTQVGDFADCYQNCHGKSLFWVPVEECDPSLLDVTLVGEYENLAVIRKKETVGV